MPEELARALESLIPSFQNLHTSLEQDRQDRIRRRKWTALAAAAFVIFVVFCVIGYFKLTSNQDATHKTLSIVQQATSAQQNAKNAKVTASAVNQIILCEYTHDNRVAEVVLHMHVEPLAPNCPADHLP